MPRNAAAYAIVKEKYKTKKRQPSRKINQPGDVFSWNPVKIQIPLGLLQRGVHIVHLSTTHTYLTRGYTKVVNVVLFFNLEETFFLILS